MRTRRFTRRDFLKASSLVGASAWLGLEAPSLAALPPTPRLFSLAYLTVFGCPPPEMTYLARRAGYDFVSLRPIPMGLPGEPVFDLARNAPLLRQTRTALASTGLRVHDIELARIQDGTDPRSLLPALEIGAELGARRVISSVWTPDLVFATECYSALCELASPLGLTIDLEFVTFASVKTLRDAVGLLRSARRENCGLLVDMLHFSRSRVRLEELDDVPREWFHFAHVCDAPGQFESTDEALARTAREERLYLGEGGIDVAAILGRMPQVTYSIELPHAARVRELGFAEHAFRCLESTRAYLDKRLA